jgi:hypothetical protein
VEAVFGSEHTEAYVRSLEEFTLDMSPQVKAIVRNRLNDMTVGGYDPWQQTLQHMRETALHNT